MEGGGSKAYVVGWNKATNGKWCYKFSNGTWAYGWNKIGGYWYYFDSGGWMTTGWQKISGYWYYLGSSADDGKMKIGWQKISGYWYYFKTGNYGKMQTGWLFDNNNYYYLRTSSGVPNSGPHGSMLASCTVTLSGQNHPLIVAEFYIAMNSVYRAAYKSRLFGVGPLVRK